MSKVIYIPGKAKNAGIKELMNKVNIPTSFGIVTTIQFLDEVNQLEGYTILGQILGCNTQSTKDSDVESYLYIGTGRFHPLNLAFQQDKPVYTLNPITKEFSKISEEEVKRYNNRKRGALLKFHAAKKIGIIVSIKSGQNQFNRALALKKKLENKEAYIFLCDNVRSMEDYNDIECWVNTACTRIVEDELPVPMINIRDIDSLN